MQVLEDAFGQEHEIEKDAGAASDEEEESLVLVDGASEEGVDSQQGDREQESGDDHRSGAVRHAIRHKHPRAVPDDAGAGEALDQ